MKKLYFTLCLSLFFYASQAQNLEDSLNIDTDTVSLYDTLDKFDYSKIQLPPVSVFIAAASSYSDVKYFEQKVIEEKLALKLSRKDWLKYVRIIGNYQYGTNSALSWFYNDQFPPGVGSSSLNTNSAYNVGINVSIPIDDLFGRKQKNDVYRSRVKQIEYESERALENRQIIILQSYNEVIKHLAILKVKAEAVALYNAQMRISEKDFVNGRIDIISLSLERSRRASASVDYQESRAALHNAVTLLEMLTKVQIIKK